MECYLMISYMVKSLDENIDEYIYEKDMRIRYDKNIIDKLYDKDMIWKLWWICWW